MNQNIIYRLSDGRLWDVQKAQWLDPITPLNEDGQEAPQPEVIELVSASGESDEAYLAKTLAFYGCPLGSLLDESPEAIKRRLAALDAKYLSPRTLAGLAERDPYAIAQWREHETQAEPLRQILANAAVSPNPDNNP